MHTVQLEQQLITTTTLIFYFNLVILSFNTKDKLNQNL